MSNFTTTTGTEGVKIEQLIDVGLDVYDAAVVVGGVSACVGVARNAANVPALKLTIYIVLLLTAIMNSMTNVLSRRIFFDCEWKTIARYVICMHGALFGARSGAEVLHAVYVFSKMRWFPIRLPTKKTLFVSILIAGLPIGALLYTSVAADFIKVQAEEGCRNVPDARSAIVAHGVSLAVCCGEVILVIGFLIRPIREIIKMRSDIRKLAEAQLETRRTRIRLRRELIRAVLATLLSAATFLAMASFDAVHLCNIVTTYDKLWFFASAATSNLASLSLIMSVNPAMAYDSILWRKFLSFLQWVSPEVYALPRAAQPQANATPPQQLPLLALPPVD